VASDCCLEGISLSEARVKTVLYTPKAGKQVAGAGAAFFLTDCLFRDGRTGHQAPISLHRDDAGASEASVKQAAGGMGGIGRTADSWGERAENRVFRAAETESRLRVRARDPGSRAGVRLGRASG